MCVSQVVSTELDTDNLKLDDLGDAPGMEIGAELEAIMLTGACIDTAFETNEELHPRGTQLLLQDSRSKPLQDTIVMSNLGYFQLKTAPGGPLLSWHACCRTVQCRSIHADGVNGGGLKEHHA